VVTERTSPAPVTAAAILIFAIVATLFEIGQNDYPKLHTILDSCVFLLSGMLAWSLWDMAVRREQPFEKCLAVSFAFTSALEFVHVFDTIDWIGALGPVAANAGVLRATTWPPTAYMLPIAIGCSLWMLHGKRERVMAFALALAALSAGLLLLFYRLPRYADPAWFGMSRPNLILVPFCWLVVVRACWAARANNRLLRPLATMGLILLVADAVMLYSQAPHDANAMVAHVGTIAGYVVMLVAMMQLASGDARDRVRVEQKFRSLLESAPDAIVIVNRQGDIVLVNSQAEKLFGFPRAELLERKIEMLIPRSFHHRHPGHRDKFFSDPRSRPMGAGLELLGLRKDGTEFPVEISLSPLETEEGILVSSAIRDITERKRFEQALREKNVELEKASRAKDNFLASMSHELRTPLNAVLGFTGILLMKLPGPLTDEQDKQLRTVQSSAKHLLSLINDLLDVARIAAEKMEVNLEPVDARIVVEEVAATMVLQATKKGLEFGATLPVGPLILSTDRRALSQIVLNLTSNAIKFTDRGSVRLVLDEAEIDARRALRIVVRDTGVGIAPEQWSLLFRPFSRLESSRKSVTEGTGLGLHLSAQLAALLGGAITLESTPGSGSAFTLTLPVQ